MPAPTKTRTHRTLQRRAHGGLLLLLIAALQQFYSACCPQGLSAVIISGERFDSVCAGFPQCGVTRGVRRPQRQQHLPDYL